MRTARSYIAREIFRSTSVVLIALLGLFTFSHSSTSSTRWVKNSPHCPVLSSVTLDADQTLRPAADRLADRSDSALAGLAQRNELVIFRVSGVSGMELIRMLWTIALPIILDALLLSEFLTPFAETKSSEANLVMRGKVEGGMLNTGYWFKEPTESGGIRVINIGKLQASGNVANLKMYEYSDGVTLVSMSQADTGRFVNGKLVMTKVIENKISPAAKHALADAKINEWTAHDGSQYS